MSVSTMFRVSIISSLIFTIMVSSTGSVTAQTASQQSSPGQLVDALHSAFGNHSSRAVHAKELFWKEHLRQPRRPPI
ncbi:MAG: hypothetical protein ABIN89_22905 [Chitinophagaceae bacterium]